MQRSILPIPKRRWTRQRRKVAATPNRASESPSISRPWRASIVVLNRSEAARQDRVDSVPG